MNPTILTWNMRGIISSTLCLSNVMLVTGCDLAIICEHKLKPISLSYMNSIDTIYHSVSKTDKLNDFFDHTHVKDGISIMYTSSLQFSAE